MTKINKKGFKGVDSPVINLKLQKIIEKQKKLDESLKNLISESASPEALIESLVKGFRDGIESALETELEAAPPKLQIAASKK